MGLGPPVCEKCQVIATIKEWKWVCPICGNPNPKDHAGFDLDRCKELKANEDFLRFTQGLTTDL